jgi:hypothetical protein
LSCAADQIARSNRIVVALAGTDAQGTFDGDHEDLAIADAAGLGCRGNRFNDAIDEGITDYDFKLHLGQEIHDIFGAAIEFGVALLASKALGLGSP